MKFTSASDILEHAEKQRELLAKQLFDADTVFQQIQAASDKGFFHLRISQEEPIDLEGTKYAWHLTKALRKAGFKAEWITFSTWEFSGKRQTDASFVFTELSISWGDVFRRGGEQGSLGA